MTQSSKLILGVGNENPPTPAAGKVVLYPKADGLYTKNDAGLEKVFSMAVSGAAIASFQSGLQSFTGGTYDKTINAVDISKTMLIYSGCNSAIEMIDFNMLAYMELINSTTLRFTRNYAGGYASNINYVLLEFASGIKSIQRGVTFLAGQNTVVTISAVDLTKSFVNTIGFWAYSDYPRNVPFFPVVSLPNTTTVRIAREAYEWVDNKIKMAWQVVEFE